MKHDELSTWILILMCTSVLSLWVAVLGMIYVAYLQKILKHPGVIAICILALLAAVGTTRIMYLAVLQPYLNL